MRYKFLEKNSPKTRDAKLQYYVLKFIIPSNIETEVFYTNMNSEQVWIKKIRGYIGDNVGCI
jgi:hypothetical protein